jgi:excisionase family DNA binding protein
VEQQLEKLLTPREAASLLGVRVSTLYTWAQRHRVPVQYVGRCLRFSPSALVAWLSAQSERVRAEDNADLAGPRSPR